MLKRTFLVVAATLGLAAMAPAAQAEKAIFAGGCFWSTQKAFDQVPGVTSTRAGFYGGTVKNPDYMQVVRGNTGHVESVEVTYDPKKVSYSTLLDAYWKHTDPTDPNGVICDKGPGYRTAIFATSAAQFDTATASKAGIQAYLKKTVVTKVVKASTVALPFYAAEDYHQHYWRTHKSEYDRYHLGCGRAKALKKLWG